MVNHKPYFIVASLLFCVSCQATDPVEQSARQLAERVVPEQASQFVFKHQPSETDFFELHPAGDKIEIVGNNGVSMARGLNHYLRHYAHASLSWCGNNLPASGQTLPAPADLHIDAQFPLRYYLNYCTYSYSMPFWDWSQWEQEIDRMAMQGINMPLMAVESQYAVWQQTLRRLGYTEQEITEFLPGAGYEAWWLMGNLEGFGGPVSQGFIDQQTELQQKMLARMRELGMTPVFQGFYGMVPNSLKEHFPDAAIREQGNWFSYQRPAFLDPTDPLFDSIANIYYEEQQKLFGEAKYYGGDPFHEGGTTQGIDVTKAATNIAAAMRRHNPEAVWVLQGWQHNPIPSLLEGLQHGEAVILDLMACERPQWGGIESSMFYRPYGHMHHDWIWCALPNFGGKTGLHGKMSSYASGPVYAKSHPMGKNIKGVGTTAEGIGTIPVVYDMVYDMAWRTDSIDIPTWINEYAHYRYGVDNARADSAWQIMSQTIYECHNELGGPVESYICARPADQIPCVSSWGNAVIFYDPMRLVEAWRLMHEGGEELLLTSDTYRYDVVDLTRQVMGDYFKRLHARAVEAYNRKDAKAFDALTAQMLQLIADDDRVLATRPEFNVGTWINEARNAGVTADDKAQFVVNAKRQITTWSHLNTALHDYAHKEWSGLMADLYLPRWQAWVDYKKALLAGRQADAPDYFALENAWVEADKHYPLTDRSGDNSVATVREVFATYYPLMVAEYSQDK